MRRYSYSKGYYIVVTEKPSVAKAIRNVLMKLGVKATVTSVYGHFMDVDIPSSLDWGKVDPLKLFDLDRKDLVYVVRNKKVYSRLKDLFRRYKGSLVIATDNDSEGELIGYEILKTYESVTRSRTEYFRMRFNSIAESELVRAWNNLERGLNWRWVYKAMFRQSFDLITGAAFTRLLTTVARRFGRIRLVSWGSCQTPTLYFVVSREREREGFVSRDFWFLEARLLLNMYVVYVRSDKTYDYKEVLRWYGKVKDAHYGIVYLYEESQNKVLRPLPLRTDDLLRDLVKLTRKSATKILGVAEDLYSKGYISYPRTDTNIWPREMDFISIRNSIIRDGDPLYDTKIYLNDSPMPRNGRMDDKAHPPIYPLKPYPSDDSLDRFVWEYVARRFLANVFTNDAVRVSQNLKIDIEGIIFSASGTYFVDDGFYKVYHYFRPREARLPSAKSGDTAKVLNIWIRKDKTKPPSRLSEADLLAKMEMAGIGTDATRASYPKLIIDRGYAKKVRGRFVPTILGVKLIESLENVDPQLVTPDTRRFVEELMEKIGFGYESIDNALRVSLEKYKKFYLECIDKLDNIKSRFMEAVGGRDSE